jgi:glycosyltransferase involved in cell wall biosynthesis
MRHSEAVLDVSVVMPAYNRSALITRSLDSILHPRRPREIIVVDDASADDTAEQARLWGERRGFPVTVERLAKNGGAAAARNRGMALAGSRYVAFLDSDDEHLPGTLERLVGALDEHPEAVLAFGDATKITPTQTITGAMFRRKVDLDRVADAADAQLGTYRLRDAKSTLLRASLVPTSASCFRRTDALAVGGMPTAFRTGEDWLFWLRLSERGAFVLVPDDLALHYRHAENLTHPNSAANTSREKLLGYLSLLDGSAGIAIDRAQRASIEAMVRERAALLRYQASRLGLRGYLRHMMGIPGYSKGAALGSTLADPKSMLRALASSFTRLPAPALE